MGSQRVGHDWATELNWLIANKGQSGQSYGFSNSHVWMWELDYKESWALKNWCFWTVVLEKTLERPLDCKEIQPVHPKGDQSWVFIGRTYVEAETPMLCHLMWRVDSLEKTLMPSIPGAGGEGDNRGWDGWMASLTRWTWVCVNSRSWWWTGRPGVLRFMGSQRVRHEWANELNWTELKQPLMARSEFPALARTSLCAIFVSHLKTCSLFL